MGINISSITKARKSLSHKDNATKIDPRPGSAKNELRASKFPHVLINKQALHKEQPIHVEILNKICKNSITDIKLINDGLGRCSDDSDGNAGRKINKIYMKFKNSN